MQYVTDTHSLLMHFREDPKLPLKAKEIFDKADEGVIQIAIPCIIFFEIILLLEKKRIQTDFNVLTKLISSSNNYIVEPMCLPVIGKCKGISREKIKDPWDRLIAATALHLGTPLITKDENIRKVASEIGLQTIWE